MKPDTWCKHSEFGQIHLHAAYGRINLRKHKCSMVFRSEFRMSGQQFHPVRVKRPVFASVFAIGGALCLFAPAAQARNSDGLPSPAPSIANRPVDAVGNGPLLARAKAAINAANVGDEKAFGRFLAPDASSQLKLYNMASRQRVTLTAPMIKAAVHSCVGPYPFDEGKGWVQFSWVCRIDAQAPLRQYVDFKYSPELSMTVWFKDDKISAMEASEPLPIPGFRLTGWSAFCINIAQGEAYPYGPTPC